MLKKFLCFADSSSCALTNRSSDPNGTLNLPEEFSSTKIQVVKIIPEPPRCSCCVGCASSTGQNSVCVCFAQEDTQPNFCLPPTGGEVSSDLQKRHLWTRFKTWFRGLFVCSKEQQSCNPKLTAWKSFRKDQFGKVPIAMQTSHLNRINNIPATQSRIASHLPHDSVPPPPYDAPSENFKFGLYNDGCLRSRLYDDDSSFCSMETGGSRQEYEGRETPWCKLLYWEGNERRGNAYQVVEPAVNVLGDIPHGTGLSLAAFFGSAPRDERIRRTRRKICQGLVLWREGDEVWVYNRSEASVYLNSASLDGSFFNLNLYKCPPGYAMIIYYYKMAHALMQLPDYAEKNPDKADVNSVRISFAKGWGKNYHRRDILRCPCWIEVHILPTLRVEQMTPPR